MGRKTNDLKQNGQAVNKPLMNWEVNIAMKRFLALARGALAVFFLVLSVTAVHAQTDILTNVPDYAWQYGCVPTSATMLVAYYAYNGYNGLSYSNLIPGGTPPLNDYANPSSMDSYINTMATDMGTSKGSPPPGNTGTGGTYLYYFVNGNPFTARNAIKDGYQGNSGEYGLYEYVTNAGYKITTADVFTQLIQGYVSDVNGHQVTATHGFTFAEFEAQIALDMPVLIDVTGHMMLGYGYSVSNGVDTVYVYNTWNSGGGTMTWGGSYDGLQMWGITDLLIAGGSSPVPIPATMILLGPGLAGLAAVRKKLKN